MAVVMCPWCQSEIPTEEGQEPDKWCPVCDNEIEGYRTLRIGLGEEEDPDDEEGAVAGAEPAADYNRLAEEDVSWINDDELQPRDAGLLVFEEKVEKLLDEQAVVPECPQCREYMLLTGEVEIAAERFRGRQSTELGGGPVLEAPISLGVYVCPSCFTVVQELSEASRESLLRRISGEGGETA